jgi:hypothetical protein
VSVGCVPLIQYERKEGLHGGGGGCGLDSPVEEGTGGRGVRMQHCLWWSSYECSSGGFGWGCWWWQMSPVGLLCDTRECCGRWHRATLGGVHGSVVAHSTGGPGRGGQGGWVEQSCSGRSSKCTCVSGVYVRHTGYSHRSGHNSDTSCCSSIYADCSDNVFLSTGTLASCLMPVLRSYSR